MVEKNRKWVLEKGIMESCLDDPCQNSAKCVTINNDHSRCLCPEGFQGVFCEFAFQEAPVDDWSSMQTLFLFAFVLIIAAALVIFCYGSELSCYVFVPRARKYDRWIGPDLDDWDFEDDADLDEVVYSISGGTAPDNRLRRSDFIELKDRQVVPSDTTETLIGVMEPSTSSSQP
ncbi:hypothetical protein L596_021135 [Steinernema carpocapsae]|uniref:EGF-like domain-containing protein n=1 Tax=Steinernema carpocapsae TaxID=34508 RepID=A0A4U5MVJ6_STECR|nr:hypothetical protein L596_021135 [Steinernema carpocapsae]